MEQSPVKILIVDDEDSIRFTLDMLLQRRGYNVMTAASGEEAMVLLQQQAFDLLLLDLKMPGLSGWDVAQQARECQPEASIIILTGHGALESGPDNPSSDISDYMLKTASPQEVLARVAATIARRHETPRQKMVPNIAPYRREPPEE